MSISKIVKNAVNIILNSDGQKGITCKAEYEKLSGLLAGTIGKDNREFIEGFMLEWEDREAHRNKTEEAKTDVPNVKTEETQPVENKPVAPHETKPVDKERHAESQPVKREQPVNKKPNVVNNHNHNVTNDNDFTQRGKINIGPGARVTIITPGNSNNQNVGKLGDKPEDIENNKPVKQGLTSQEKNAAQANGRAVADYLIGMTTDAEQGLTKNIIQNEVNERNIMEFIRGYSENDDWGNKLFEQLESEWGFEEAQKLMKKLADDLSKFCRNNKQSGVADKIDVILDEYGFDRKDARVRQEGWRRVRQPPSPRKERQAAVRPRIPNAPYRARLQFLHRSFRRRA
jgi:hypothetical protein